MDRHHFVLPLLIYMRKAIRNNFFIALLVLLPVNNAFPGEIRDNSKRLAFERIQSIENNSFGIVEAIAQDSFGFIWLGAKDGLSRYDGIRFYNYVFDKSDTTSLSNNIVRDLFVDSRGNLWIGTENGLNLYNTVNDNFTRFISGQSNSGGISDNNIRKIIEDTRGDLWIASLGGGIVKYVDSTGNFIPLSEMLKGGADLLSGNIHTLFLDRENIFWIGTADKGVLYFRGDELILKKLPEGRPDGRHLNGTEVQAIAEDDAGEIWIGTNGSGLNCYSRETQLFTYYSGSRPGSDYLNSDIISSLTVDSKGILWVCTDGGGLNRFDPESRSFHCFRTSLSDPLSISSDIVRKFFEDNAGNYWIGNFNAPVNYVNANNKKFFSLRDILPASEAPNQNKITAILKTGNGDLWLATDGDGMIRFDSKSGSYKNYRNSKGERGSLPNNKPVCLETDQDGNIWIGHFEGGISCFHPKQNKFLHFYPDGTDNNPVSTQVWDIRRYGDTLWIAGNGGLEYLDLKSRKFKKMTFEGSGTAFDHYGVWTVIKDSRGRLLIGTYNGFFVYDLKLNQLRHYLPSLSNPACLSDKWVLTIFEDKEKRIWVGTNGGGLDLWEEPDRFTCYSNIAGLEGSIINAILEDEKSYLWISTNRGISKFDPDSIKATNYSDGDGLWGNRLNIHSAFKAAEGTMYFGGNNGVNYFIAGEIEKNSYIPPVVITGLDLFDKPSGIKGKDSPYYGNMLLMEPIRLGPRQKIFTIHFASLNYSQADKNQYKYRLEGFEEEWNMVGNQHLATYTNLRAGKYIFHVMGSNQDGVWNPDETSLRIIIRPPFYKTAWFVILIIGLTGFLVYSLYRMQIGQFSKLNSRLSELVSARTLELELRNREIADQNQKIIKQRDVATAQRDQIIRINEELEKHRSRLEELVEERTQDLVIARDRAEQGDRLKTAFLENLSSQIRSPLNAIIGFVNLLSEKIDDKISRDYYLKIINESGKSMMSLIQDIIDFSRMQTGHLQPEYTECRINDLIRDLITSARMRASREKPNLSIVADLPEKEILMYTDGKKLVQIFSKLLENSLKYTAEGNIALGIQTSDEKWITFFVRDTGIGIKTDKLDKIFNLFYTSMDSAQDEDTRGSGLGLAFAKVSTELLGGRIWAESKEGEGSGFYLKLPFRQIVPDYSRKQQQEKKYQWPEKNILVAEDEESNYLLIDAFLKDTGITIIRCEDGIELLERIDIGMEYDLVLLDLKMPRMGGINALKLIRESNPDVPVIIQTAYDQEIYRRQCLDLGCTDFLVKPLRKKDLLETIEKYLKGEA
jgi:signal transduction histidine kinase/ligand-binding sensor domain-containing protein/CheY-like chemotaxis protein